MQVLARRAIRRGVATVEQFKIRWTGQTSAEVTWEDAAALRSHFPHAPAWGQAGSEEGGDVTTTTSTAHNPTLTNPVRHSPRVARNRRANVWLAGPEWVGNPAITSANI